MSPRISTRSSRASAAFPSRSPILSRPPRRSSTESRRNSPDRKSTRLNSSHGYISYAVFCLKKKELATIALLVAGAVGLLYMLGCALGGRFAGLAAACLFRASSFAQLFLLRAVKSSQLVFCV